MSSQTTVGFSRENIKIPSATPECNLDAWLYLPTAFRKPHPVIIMAHCISLCKFNGLAHYAEAFAAEGYASVVFDYRRWGESDGSPRYLVNIREYQEDYRTVIKYCRSQSSLDPNRVILWGTTYSGGHVVKLASEPELNIAAVIANCPYLGDGFNPDISLTTLKIAGYAIMDLFRQIFGLSPLYVPATGRPGDFAVVSTPDVHEKVNELHALAERPDFKAPNLVSPWSAMAAPLYRPERDADKITCPVLIIAAMRDNLVSSKRAVEVSKRIPKSELLQVDAEHFDFYAKQKYWEKGLTSQLDYLRRNIPI